jgi:hypothetical protein
MPSLIGNKPNQVPSNGDLGTMAFREQDQFYNTQQSLGFKNRIINGAMVIDQRNAGASVTPTTTGYTLDRWRAGITVGSKFSVQQSSTAPNGFTKSALITSLSAYSVSSGDILSFQQFIEGNNTADLGWGTASAATVTLSFWVRSSLTGTFGGALSNNDANRSYPFTYTISAANTWEQKSITIAGDTSGTWETGNLIGIQIRFGLGVGSTYSGTAGAWSGSNFFSATGATSVVGTNGATFYITGVQLEKGSTATSFDYRPYGTELALCQRYYQKTLSTGVGNNFGIGYNGATTVFDFLVFFLTEMRTQPSALEQSGTAADYSVNFAGGTINCSSVPIFRTAANNSITIRFTVASGLTSGQGGYARAVNSNAFLAWSAEL